MMELYDTVIEDLKAVSEHDFHRLRCLCEEIAQRIGKFTWQKKFIGELLLSVDLNNICHPMLLNDMFQN